MLWDRSPVKTLVYCGDQTTGWIKITLGTEVGLGLGNVVLDGEPAPPTESSTAAPSSLFSPSLLRTNSRPSQQLLSSCKSLL